MMKCYLNELSLSGQFNSPELFIEHLKKYFQSKINIQISLRISIVQEGFLKQKYLVNHHSEMQL
ncbi:Uncharacterised protein [Raoultella terrigena]|uniref:Uncharacterized protein n=1 Tax=Raoultella terrigena TaxID=577 RepID=A0A4U9D6R8_RAOTE|nr:Uncharacterised protein [Raoultella terrigena]